MIPNRAQQYIPSIHNHPTIDVFPLYPFLINKPNTMHQSPYYKLLYHLNRLNLQKCSLTKGSLILMVTDINTHEPQ